MISLLLSCGNMADICSTCDAVNRRLLLDVNVLEDDREEKYRYVKNIIMATTMREGMEMVASSSRAMTKAGRGGRCWSAGDSQDGAVVSCWRRDWYLEAI